MDGIHDMGGMHGFGKVEPEPNEPVFHAEWEGRCLALNRAMGYTGIWTIDQTRAGIEELPPDVYLASSYYRKWALRLENLVVAMRPCRMPTRSKPATRCGRARPSSASSPPSMCRTRCRAAHSPGQRRHRRASSPAIACAPKTFTRRRTRACRVTRAIASAWSRRCAAVTSFPTPRALGKGDDPQWLYTVLFEGRELWGDSAEPSLKVSIEAFEPYLEPA